MCIYINNIFKVVLVFLRFLKPHFQCMLANKKPLLDAVWVPQPGREDLKCNSSQMGIGSQNLWGFPYEWQKTVAGSLTPTKTGSLTLTEIGSLTPPSCFQSSWSSSPSSSSSLSSCTSVASFGPLRLYLTLCVYVRPWPRSSHAWLRAVVSIDLFWIVF